ncbi:MAG: YjbH domain-containing protein [Bacteroidia bacterium]|nr:YjbH domain-containing protein [Bacteroidia bacterium]
MSKISRRKFFFIGMAALSAIPIPFILTRIYNYPKINSWDGKILSHRHASILFLAAQEFIPEKSEIVYQNITGNIDSFLSKLPETMVSQVRDAVEAFENMTFLTPSLNSFSQMASPARQEYLERMFGLGGIFRLVAKTIRDLCLFGYYQQDSSWASIRYLGPMVAESRSVSEQYLTLVASSGDIPKSLMTE